MKSRMESAIGVRHKPVAIGFADEKPDGARQFSPGKWGCVMFMLGRATKGDQAVFDRNTFGCFGGGTGLGFGNQYKNFPGGEDGFCSFLSDGNEKWEQGREAGEAIRPHVREEFMENFNKGERYIKTPGLVRQFIKSLPMIDIGYRYVLFKPLEAVDPKQWQPEVVVFLGDMDQVSAMSVLANYHRETNDNVIFPFAAGCMSIGIYPFREARSHTPRAVLGLNDISARVAIKRQLKDDVMSFAIPFSLFREMEENVPGSFLERPTWQALMELKGE